MTDLAGLAALRATIDAEFRRDFGMFAHRAFRELEGSELEPNWHIDAIVARMVQIEKGEVRRQIICLPPRYLKTFLISIAFVAWMLGRNPRARFICCSYSGDLAEKFSADTMRLMRTAWYRRVFPGTIISATKQSKTDFETTRGGSRYATSVGGTLTGRGADYIIVDDPLKANEAHSAVARENSIDWFNNSVRTRLNNPSKGAIIIVAQRLHAEDLPGALLSSSGWDELVIPAIQQRDTIYDMRPGQKPHVMPAGTVLQPARHDLIALKQLKIEMGEQAFEAQYNQQPLPPGGATFKAEWIKRYQKPPHASHIQAIVQSWDTAYESSEDNDYSVCTTWAICEKAFYLLDLWRGRPAFWELEQAVYDQRARQGAQLVIVERAASGISLIQNIRDRARKQWLVNIKPEGSKVNRAEQQTPKFERGQIYLPEVAPWLKALEDELFSFPHCKHDDQVDSIVQFLSGWDTGKLLDHARAFGRQD